MKAQTLVAMNHGAGDRSIEPVLRFIDQALLDHQVITQPHWRTKEPNIVHRVTFDADQVRNTEVHGIGYRAGFIVHIES